MSDLSSSLSSPQNPKLRHPHPAVGSLSTSVGLSKTENKTNTNTTDHHHYHHHDHESCPTKSLPLSVLPNESSGLENPFVVTVRSSPSRLGKSNSTNFIGPVTKGLILSSTSNKTGPRLALYRSNSSLDLLDRDNYLLRGRNLPHHAQKPESQTSQGCFTRRKDFGSHGSIDVLSSSTVSVVSGIATGCKQPALSLSMASTNRRDSTDDGQILKKSTEFVGVKEMSSPRLRIKFQKLFESKEKGNEVQSPSKGEPSATTSIFRKFRGGKDSTAPPTTTTEVLVETEGKPVLRHHGLLGTEERFRRRVFAHYDCQSVSANISYAAKLRGMLSKRRNTTTGASAASLGNRMSSTTTPSTSLNNIGAICASENSSHGGGEPSQETDLGDGHSNSLVLSCPYFRNEIGGEEEHIISSTKFNRVSKHSKSSNYGEGIHGNVSLSTHGVSRDEAHRAHSARSLSVLEWSQGKSHWSQGICPYKGPRSSTSGLEAVDLGAEYYRTYFYKQEHENWFGSDDVLGPLAISIKKEKIESDKKEGSPRHFYRLIARSTELNTLRGSILEDVVPGIKVNSKDRGIHSKEVIEFLLPEVQLTCLRLGQPSTGTEEQLLKVDQQILTHRHKIGIMYCRSSQATEEEMYNNEEAGPIFNEFLDLIGQRVRLKGFDKYTGGLDNKDDSTGLYSIYSAYQDCEVIFHVSTLLPFTPNNRQQLMRKRHIGNDIVTIVFQEPGSQPFTPKNIRSQFQHVFIIVRAINPCSESTYYSVSVSRSKEVPLFGPPIQEGAQFPKGKAFVDFLLSKAINAENATYRSEKFTTMATRTRQEYLKDLVATYSTNTPIDPRSKFSMLQFGNKKKELFSKPKYNPDPHLRGALSWSVWLHDGWMNSRIDTYLAISTDTLVVIDAQTREPIFALPTTSILGWNSATENCLRMFYHQGECVTIYAKELGYGALEIDDLNEIVRRLEAVTQGCETQDIVLRRNEIGQLGFHVQQDGVITEVESCGYAAKAGLKQGSRLVEICTLVVATLSQDEMIEYLKKLNDVVVTIIPPHLDGNIRRGCDAKHCIYTADPEAEYYENTYGALTNQNSVDDCQDSHQPHVFKSSTHSKNLLTQAVPGNHRKRYEPRSFSPPRSSNSSGYGTGSSSKSFSSDPHSLPHQEGETVTKCGGGVCDDRWYNLFNEKSDHGLTNGTNSPPPIPARNIQSKLLSNRQTHPSANTNGGLLRSYELKGETNSTNGNAPLGRNERKGIGNGCFSATPYHDKSFSAKRDFFQRNGSFQGKLSPSRSHDLLHLRTNYGLQGQSSQLRPLQRTNGYTDYEIISPTPVVMQPKRIGAEKLLGGGAVYQLAKNASNTAFTTPIIETTVKGKVTYLTDFSPASLSTENLTPNRTSDQNDVEIAKNERLAALKSAYLEKSRQERSPSIEISKLARFSTPLNVELNSSLNAQEESTIGAVKLRGTSSASSRTSSNSSPKSSEAKLRPSSTTSRGSTVGGGSDRTNRNSTLQEDLIRLINPDYLLESPTNNRSPPSLKSNGSPVTGRNITPEPTRLSSPPNLPLLPDTTVANWSTLVDTATKAFIHLDNEVESTSPITSPQSFCKSQRSDHQISSSASSLSPSIGSRLSASVTQSPSPPSWREELQKEPELKHANEIHTFIIHDNPIPGSVFNLESRVSQLEAELRKEQESKQVLASKVENLQQENRRLLEENHITQDQFNKFKEWLIGTVDPSLHNISSSNS